MGADATPHAERGGAILLLCVRTLIRHLQHCRTSRFMVHGALQGHHPNVSCTLQLM